MSSEPNEYSISVAKVFRVLHADSKVNPKGFGEKSSSFPSSAIRASVFIRQNLAQLNTTLF